MKRIVIIGMVTLVLSGLAGCAPVPPTTQDSVDLAKAAEINVKLGTAYFKQGRLKQALKKLERALQQNPDLPSAHNVLALLKQRLGRAEEAEKHFQQAIHLKPDYSAAHNNYGVFLYKQGRYREAESQFLKAISNPLYGTPALAYENAAMAALQRSDPDQAVEYYQKALRIRPGTPGFLYQLAKIAFAQGRYREAEEYLQQYKQVTQKKTPQSLWLAIRLERKLGNRGVAAWYALQLRRDFPDSEEAKRLRKENRERERMDDKGNSK